MSVDEILVEERTRRGTVHLGHHDSRWHLVFVLFWFCMNVPVPIRFLRDVGCGAGSCDVEAGRFRGWNAQEYDHRLCLSQSFPVLGAHACGVDEARELGVCGESNAVGPLHSS